MAALPLGYMVQNPKGECQGRMAPQPLPSFASRTVARGMEVSTDILPEGTAGQYGEIR